MSVLFISDDKQLEVSPYYSGALVEIGDREIDIDEEEIERLIEVLKNIISP